MGRIQEMVDIQDHGKGIRERSCARIAPIGYSLLNPAIESI